MTLRRAVALAPALIAAALAVFIVVLTAQRLQQPAYAMPVPVLVIAAVCALLTIAGAARAWLHPDGGVPWLTLLVVLLFVAAFLAIFSIGFAFAAAALALLMLRQQLARSRPRPAPRVGAGLLLSLGLAPLAVLAIQQPVVSCTSDGVSSSTPIWTWIPGSSESGSSSGSSAGSQVGGRVTIGATTYSYVCEGPRLVSFQSAAGA